MERHFDTDTLRTAIEKFPHRGRLAYLLSCAERMALNYTAFAQHHNWGDSEALQHALDLGWRSLFGHTVDADEIQASLARCEVATPDTEDFDSETEVTHSGHPYVVDEQSVNRS
jgi:uncharacterized protein YjaG (DUF416 family)